MLSLRTYDVKRVDVAWNYAFQKKFNAHWYESVKPLQHYCSFPLCYEKLLFWKKMVTEWECGSLLVIAKCC